jgi:hypothetical protein
MATPIAVPTATPMQMPLAIACPDKDFAGLVFGSVSLIIGSINW